MPVYQSTRPRTTPPLWTPAPAGTTFMRGARPSPPHKLMAAPSFSGITYPVQFAVVPSKLAMWGNNQYGDCTDSKSQVLTEKGWINWHDYDGKSLLGTMNPATGLLEFQAPLDLQRRDHDGPMVYSDHNGLDFAVTPNHRMYYRPYKIAKNGRKYIPGASGYGPYQFGTAGKLPPRFMIPGATTGFIGAEFKSLAIGGRTWEGWDFLRLLAVILSDGWLQTNEKNRNAVSFCCFRDDRREMVTSLASRLDIHEASYRRGVWTFRDAALAEWLRSNGFVGDEYKSPFKCVPDLVKVASQGQIEEFLRYFGDSSGPNRDSRQFYSSSPRMIDDLQELLLRVGKRGTVYSHGIREVQHPNEEGVMIVQRHPAYTLHEYQDSDLGMLRKNTKIDHYKGEVFCATVPNSTLVTRRNGRILISGNCVSAEEAFAKACHTPEIFIDDNVVIAWARANGYLNGADLKEVCDSMLDDGYHVGGQIYNDGPAQTVDYANQDSLRSAISQGPVKIAIDANALPSGAGNNQGWYAFGGGRYPNTDHCTGLSGYGTAAYCFSQLGVPLPSGIDPNKADCYLHFTWSTIGVVDQAWLMNTCVEAWLRMPTTIGIPPLPDPTPVQVDWFT